jgi:cytochrome c-type biogenesis protein
MQDVDAVPVVLQHAQHRVQVPPRGLRLSGQVAIGRGLARVFRQIEAWTRPVPEPILGLALLSLAAVFIVATLRDRGRPRPGGEPDPPASSQPDDPRAIVPAPEQEGGDGAHPCQPPARSRS